MNLLQHLLYALQFLFGNQRLAQLLQVQRRVKLRGDGANLIARQDVVQHFVLLQPFQQPRKQLAAQRAQAFRFRLGIEKPAGILRIVQIVAQARAVILQKKIQFLFRGFDLRAELFQLQFLMLQAQFDIVQ